MPRTHRLTGTFEHRVWKGLYTRCNNRNSRTFKFYGGRGIKICERWRSFEAFLEDMGKAPSEEHSIDRIDPNGNYEPSNCRWADWRTQCENKRGTKWIEFNGHRLTARGWAERLGISAAGVRARLRYMPIERALSEPKIAPRITSAARAANPRHRKVAQ